jgi:hypothetical protein
MPILGTVASQISGHLTSADAGAMVPLGMVQVGSGGSASISFTSIPATYKNLQVRWAIHDIGAAVGANVIATVNGSATGYARHGITANGSSATAYGLASQTNMYIGVYMNDTTVLHPGVLDIIDYANTNKYKTFRCLTGGDANGSGYIYVTSGLWQDTSAISSITFTNDNANWAQYTSMALYGIKGA